LVLRGPTAGQPMSEAGLRSVFRGHRVSSGALRVRPHRLRHTCVICTAKERVSYVSSAA